MAGRVLVREGFLILLSLFLLFLTVHAAAMSSFVATAGRARLAAATATARTALKPRCFATSLRRQDEQKSAPKPPPTIDDSTSALDYKRTMRHRPPPLPAMDLMRSRTAEEAVTNILYNTPPPSLQPFKKCVFSSQPSPLLCCDTTWDLTGTS